MERIVKKLPGKIWNLEVSPSGSVLAMEIRNEKEKRVSFFIYDLFKETWLWDNVEFEETWWLSILSTSDERVYLNYFTEENNPETKKVIEVDIAKQEVLNELDSYVPTKSNEKLNIPLHYKIGSDNFNNVAEFIKQHNGDIIVNAVDYLQNSSAIVISYYLYENEKLANYMLVTDIEGNEKGNEKLACKLDKIGMHTFFIMNNYIVAIKDKTDLMIFKL